MKIIMKNFKYKIILYSLFLVLFSSLYSCKEIETMTYEQNAGVYFYGQANASFSFFDAPGAESYIVNVPIVTMGDSANYDRKVKMEMWKGDGKKNNTTASADKYEILEGVVLSGQFKGIVPVKVFSKPDMDNKIDTIFFKLFPSEDFPLGGFDNGSFRLTITNKIIKPSNWGNLTYYIGTPFSTSWYRFILGVIGMDYIPYPSAREGDIAWSTNAMLSNVGLIKSKLLKYNMANPDKPLTHDDGDNAGEPVVMP